MIGDFYRQLHGRGDGRGAGPRGPAGRSSRRIDAIKDRGSWSSTSGARSCATSVPIRHRQLRCGRTDGAPNADAKNPDVNSLWRRPVRPRHAGARLLLLEGKALHRDPRGVPGLHSQGVRARRPQGAAPPSARRLMAFETRLAQAQWPAVKMRDLGEDSTTRWTSPPPRRRRRASTGRRWLAGLGVPDTKQMIVGQPTTSWPSARRSRASAARHLEGLPDAARDRRARAVPQRGSSSTRRVRLLRPHAVGHAGTEAALEARASASSKARSATCSARLYVARYFPPEAKAPHGRAGAEPAEGIRRRSIDELEWMGPETRKRRRREARASSR